MERKPLEVVSLSKKEFDNQRVKPDNVLFFVYEEYVSEDKKAKVRLRLYKGPHLICGDLYESVLKLGQEVNSLKKVIENGTGGGGTGGDGDVASGIDLEIGTIGNINSEIPEAEIVYCEKSKKNKLNIGFPLRYFCLSNNKEYTYNRYGVPNVKTYDLYPKELHNRLSGVSYAPTTRLLPSRIEINGDFHHEASDDFVFIEDHSPLELEGIDIKVAPYTPCLYRRYPDENMAIDYHRIGNLLYPVIRGGTVYRPVHEQDEFIEKYDMFFTDGGNDKYTCPIDLHKGNEYDDAVVGNLYADKSEFLINNKDFLELKGLSGTIDIVFGDNFLFYDSLQRFWFRFPVDIPEKIEFQGIDKDGKYYTLFAIDTKLKDNIEITPYGIRGVDRSYRQGVSIIYAQDMEKLNWIYNPASIRKISLSYRRDNIDENAWIDPAFQIRKGSFMDLYKGFNLL